MMKTPRSLLLVLPVAAWLTGCAVTQVSPPAPVVAPAAFKESGPWESGRWQRSASQSPSARPQAWWTVFHDPVLDDLVSRLAVGNENLRGLAAQVNSAKATVDASRSALWPSLSVGPSLTRSRATTNTSGNVVGTNAVNNSVALSANASWEIDLWGHLSQASAQAKAAYQASEDDLAAARLSVQSTLVQTYLSLRTAEAQAALLTRSLQAYDKSLSLTQARYDGGLAARSDVLQAQTQLKSVQAQLAESRAQRAQLEHALAVLLGVAPSSLDLASGQGTLPAAPAIPRILPSQLLQRRPDVTAARHRVEAAYAQIGVADAAYFPSLNLSASAGYRHDSLAGLLSAPNLFWSVGPSLTEVIFNGGQRELASAQARSGADQATATYRQTCLTALQEVEDNLVLADQLDQEVQSLAEALDDAQRNLDIVMAQYQGGTVSYLNVVTAQTSALNSESSLLQVRNRQLAAASLLLKNVAGAWSMEGASGDAPAAPASTKP